MNFVKWLTKKHCYTACCLEDAMKENKEQIFEEACYQITMTNICCIENDKQILEYFKKAIDWKLQKLNK